MAPSMIVGCLWFLMIAFMFFAQHHVCDAYFVPAINVFVGKMKRSDNTWLQRWGQEAVAGATICALGCNGPEMFTNLISLYTGSDAGIGVVVGSEIFNLLIIVGLTISAAPVLPLALERVPFARDCMFYALSIALLYWALLDHKIEAYEAWVLLAAAGVYVACVYFTDDFVQCIPALRPEKAEVGSESPSKKKGTMHGVEVDVEEILHGRMVDAHGGATEKWNLDATEHGIYAEPNKPPVEPEPKANARGSLGFTFAGGGDALLGPMLKYKDLKEVVLMDMGVINLEFIHNLQHITLRLTVEDAAKRTELLNNIQEYSLCRPWVHGYDATIRGAWQHLYHTMVSKDPLLDKLLAIPHFLIDGLLKLTLFAVDVKDVRKEGRWPLCFVGAMFWLAIFSFFMLEIANQIHYNIPALPNSFLGITVCAIGTSFPNAVASVLMAQQNKPAAAIANALGSNVQNVFLAMALPWVIFQFQYGGKPIDQNVAGIDEGVLWMSGTLLLVVFFVFLPPFCKLSYAYGPVLVSVYLAYLVITSGETFHWWPPLVK
ncbi:Slc24a2 [Symbiodinium necroappetens]|uniref:Slc24a2 protein n=1 Tax=Symbiodinium necroappetens TaxID=1628268 RepID=A0A813CGX8_9DINO|nr:Slc24a2 [Symbiodinium necroappetens]|mmetsp:Transcript_77225/g.184917  ORF Transcript_77225/g.184917 Transcript_77225/m.184917 type:complete len:545 (-) Transcript_77225:121-1755(-)